MDINIKCGGVVMIFSIKLILSYYLFYLYTRWKVLAENETTTTTTTTICDLARLREREMSFVFHPSQKKELS